MSSGAATTELRSSGPEQSTALLGHRVALVGRLANMSTHDLEEAVTRAGGRMSSAVNRATTLVVVGSRGWPLMARGQLPAKLVAAERLRSAGKRIDIVSEDVFRERLGLHSCRDEQEHKSLSAGQVAAALGVHERIVRRWEQLGLVRARDGRYDFRDLVSLRTVSELVARGVNPAVIRTSLAGLAEVLPGVERPLAQLNILVTSSGSLVAELEDALVGPGGQLEMKLAAGDCSRRDDAGHGVAVRIRSEEDADALVARGLHAEDRGDWAEAERCYRSAAEVDPGDAAGPFNLGNALLHQGRFAEAAASFELTIAIDPLHTRALFNLAHAQDAQHDLRAAARSLRCAVAIEPDFADAWFNLADVSERSGELDEALRAWERYLALDPSSPWSQEARRRLNGSRSPAWA